MNSKHFDITLNGYLPSLLEGLSSEGINANKYLANPYLKKLDLFNPNSYIPNILLEEFLVALKKDHGIDSLASDFSHHFQIIKIGRVSKYMFQSDTFLTFLERALKCQKKVRSNYSINLKIYGPTSKLSVRINEAQSPGKLICEEIDIMRILDGFMLVGGPSFTPIELGITGSSSYNIESILP